MNNTIVRASLRDDAEPDEWLLVYWE